MGVHRLRVLLGLTAAFVAFAPLAVTADRAGDPSALREAGAELTLLSRFDLATSSETGDKRVSVIITLDEEPVSSYTGGIADFAATNPATLGQDRIDASSPDVQRYAEYLKDRHVGFGSSLASTVRGATVTQTYEMIIGGVAAFVPQSSLGTIAAMDGVTGVYADELNQLDTEVSPGFIGADDLWTDLGGQSVAGEGVIVGVIDSGIWPEHPSVSDPDPAGNPYPAPPAHWTGSGTGTGCDFGDAFNANDAPFTCNNKLLGAYDFTETYALAIGLIPTEFHSARDSNGHGTHTLTTAAGNGGVEASISGTPRGTVSGIAPRARVVAYKGCGLQGCFSSDTSAAFQQAIIDGVDVINYSISGGGAPYGDIVSLAMLDAYDAGTLVVPSAGNSGPGSDTVAHREPWTLTVGASTTDRHFLSTLDLVADNSDTLTLVGASVTAGITTPTPVIYPPAGEEQCLNPLAPGTFSGEIVICDRGTISRVEKSFNVAEGGAGGMLLRNLVPQGLATDNHFIPSVHLEDLDGLALEAFMTTHTGVTGMFTPGTSTAVQGDVMASFSSRGGSGQTLGISKPDVTAPGVQILAGHTPMPEDNAGGLPGQLFQSIQGTSMSAPHSTGAAALVKAAHPEWTPGEIKSALMMTALTSGVTKEDGVTPADPFDFGSGRILPDAAADAQLTISDSGPDFLALENNLWDANYPSLYIPALAGSATVTRTLSNPTADSGTWDLTVSAPPDLGVIVPPTVAVAANGETSFDITVDGRDVPIGETRFATLMLEKTNSPMLGQQLHFPITIVRGEAGVTIDKACTPSSIAQGATTDCDITVENTTFDPQDVSIVDLLPEQLELVPGSVVGGANDIDGSVCRVGADVSLAGAAPAIPVVTIDPLASPFGYSFPLSGFAGSIDVGATDESIVNFGVPTFEYGGVSYDTIGIVSNGYVIPGGGTGADVNFINSDLPDPATPNNVLAPFWTDLNPAAGGTVWVNALTDGTNVWTVVEWEMVPNFSDGLPNTAQIWLGSDTDADPAQDISFTYGPDITGGDGGFLTVGAENSFGNEGDTVYFDGAGTPPSPSFPNPPGVYEVDVSSIPGAPGGSHTLSFSAAGKDVGTWTNYAEMVGTGIVGTAFAGATGETTPGAAPTWPTVTIAPAATQGNPTNDATIEFDIEFDTPVVGISPKDVIIGGTAGPTTVAVSGTGTSFTASVSGMTNDGTVTAAVQPCATTDGAGNTSTGSSTAEVLFDGTPPAATLMSAAGQDDPTGTSPIEFVVTFSEDVSGLDASGIALGGTAGPTTVVVTPVDASTFELSVSGMTSDGTVVVRVLPDVAFDAVGNGNTQSSSEGVTFETQAPDVTVEQGASQPDPTNTSPIVFTVEFTEIVTGFDATDVTLGGTAGATTATVTGSGTTYTVEVTGMTSDGTVTADVPAGAATDTAGNTNTASTSTDNEVTYDTAAPDVTVEQGASQPDPTNTSPIVFTVEFTEIVTGFDATDVTLGGTAGATTATVTGSGTTYTVEVTGMTSDGTVTADVPAGAATDTAGSTNTASTSTDNEVTYDTAAPDVTVEQGASQPDPTNTSPIVFTVEFTESVTGFDATDVTLGGTAGATTATVTGSGTTYTVEVTGMTSDGTVTADVPAGAATDTAGSTNTASTSTDNEVTYDTTAPTITIPDGGVVTANNDPGEAGANVDFIATAGALTRGGGVLIIDAAGKLTSIVCDPASGSFFPIGTTTVTCTASDDAGNSATASFNVVVVDNEDPVMPNPGTVRIALPLAPAAVDYPLPEATDNSGTVRVVCDPMPGTVLDVGTTPASCTATDPSGNSVSTSFDLFILAPELPKTGGGLSGLSVGAWALSAGIGMLLISRLRRRRRIPIA